MLQAGATAMAKFSCASAHQQLLQPKFGTATMAQGFCGKQMQQQLGCCSSRSRMQAAASHGGVVATMIKPGRLETGGMGKNGVLRRISAVASPSSCHPADDAAIAASGRENSGFGELLGGTKDVADISDGRDGKSAVSDDAAVNESLWRFGAENLIQGHVGRYAFLATLLLGVGVGCLTSIGDAEAATSHMKGIAGLDGDMRALALGPEGPLVEEFWDNIRRYGFYFLTVVSGGAYSLVKPAIDALKNPVTAVLIIIVISGSIYLVGLTVSAMLGINEYKYDFAV